MSGHLNRFRRILALFRRHHRHLFRALFVVAIIRIGLVFRTYKSIFDRSSVFASRLQPIDASPQVIVWSVKHVAKLVPGALCLAQALSVRYLLLRARKESIVRVGVKSDEKDGLGAHAWVIYEGRCIIGGSEEELRTYTPLCDL